MTDKEKLIIKTIHPPNFAIPYDPELTCQQLYRIVNLLIDPSKIQMILINYHGINLRNNDDRKISNFGISAWNELSVILIDNYIFSDYAIPKPYGYSDPSFGQMPTARELNYLMNAGWNREQIIEAFFNTNGELEDVIRFLQKRFPIQKSIDTKNTAEMTVSEEIKQTDRIPDIDIDKKLLESSKDNIHDISEHKEIKEQKIELIEQDEENIKELIKLSGFGRTIVIKEYEINNKDLNNTLKSLCKITYK